MRLSGKRRIASIIVGIRSGQSPYRRLRQSAAVDNRSPGLRRVIFTRRGGSKGRDRLA